MLVLLPLLAASAFRTGFTFRQPIVCRRAPRPLLLVERDEGSADDSNSGSSGLLPAVLSLNAATLIWGSQHAVIKGLIETDVTPVELNAVRFGLAAAVALPLVPSIFGGRRDGGEERPPALQTWLAGAELSLYQSAGFGLQAIGLTLTSASRSAFLLYLNVKLVPILAALLYGRSIPLRTWLAAGTALVGTALLANDGAPPNAGDAWSAAAALASAMFILRLESASARAGCDAAELNAATLTCTATLFAGWLAFETAGSGTSPQLAAEQLGALAQANAAPLLYLSIVTTAVAQWLQARGQARVSAQDAAIIYALDPVYAAAFSWLLLGEELGTRGYAGALLVLGAVWLSRVAPDDDDEAVPVVEGDAAAVDAAAEPLPLRSEGEQLLVSEEREAEQSVGRSL